MALIGTILLFSLVSVSAAIYLITSRRGAKVPANAVWTVVMLGVLGYALSSALALLLPDVKNETLPFTEALRVAIFVGVVEEAVKCLPLIAYFRNTTYIRTRTDGVIYFAVCGLSFGLVENVAYVLEMGPGAALARLSVSPLFHAAAAAIVGYAYAGFKLRKVSIGNVVLAFLAAASIHTLYDLGLFMGMLTTVILSAIISVSMTIGLFLLHSRALLADYRGSKKAARSSSSSGADAKSKRKAAEAGLSGIERQIAESRAKKGIVFATLSLTGVFVPGIGIILAVTALVYAVKSRKSASKNLHQATVALACFGILISAYLFVTNYLYIRDNL
jgi:RsiW-degrading membrane proteinase PrsW (M82 family)